VGQSREFIDFLIGQMRGFGAVSARRMFGGAGLFRDGLMFALVADDTLYLKADDVSDGEFEAEGLPPFSYATSDGRRTIMSYRRAPETCLEDDEAMAAWCGKAFAAARRASDRKRPGKRAAEKAVRP